MKICKKCNQKKLLSDFYNSKSHKDGKMGNCKSCFNIISTSNTDYRKNYKNKHKTEYNKQWRESNPEYFKTYYKEWYKNNKHKINNYQKIKKQKDPIYKISSCIRTRISQTLSGYSKSKSTLEILNVCNFKEFKNYIESKFTDGMDWNNYGYGKDKWVIDHIIPLASAITEQDIYILNHHTNLQPMWWNENMIKGAKIL